MKKVSFNISGLDQLMNREWRWLFREDCEKWVENLKLSLPGIPMGMVVSFYRGTLDAKVSGTDIELVISHNDLRHEIYKWMCDQYVKHGEAVEIYFEGMTMPENLVNRLDFDCSEDYYNEFEETRILYRNYYDKEVEKYKKMAQNLNWVNTHFFMGEKTLPNVRSMKEIKQDLELDELRCKDFNKVDYHALLMDVEGNVWWYGENVPYQALQHMNLHSRLRNLGVNSIDYSLGGESNICYDPSHHWRFNISSLTNPQIETLIQFALDRGEDHIKGYGLYDNVLVDDLVKLLSGEIQWHEI